VRLTLLFRRLLYIATLVAFLILVTMAAALLNRGPDSSVKIRDLGPYPPFSIPGLSADDLKGRAAMITFSASWCAPCVKEHPVLMELSKIVPIYGVDFMDKPDAMDSFLKRAGNPFRKMGYDADGVAAVAWGMIGIPTSFIVDRRGHIVYRHDGPFAYEDIKSVSALMEKLK
jgi:cytochrome c biogenesis protein CcmG/thiol:disulfide interchange protein DsbE